MIFTSQFHQFRQPQKGSPSLHDSQFSQIGLQLGSFVLSQQLHSEASQTQIQVQLGVGLGQLSQIQQLSQEQGGIGGVGLQLPVQGGTGPGQSISPAQT